MTGLHVELPDDVVERIAELAAEIVLARLADRAPASSSEFLTVAEAAELLRAKPQRVYDLLSAGRLTRHRDGSRVLVSRAELVAHLSGVTPRLPQRPRSRMGTGVSR